MGVSVRMSRNTRVYLPFWLAIPLYLLVAAVWLAILVVWSIGWIVLTVARAVSQSRSKAAITRKRSAARVPGSPVAATPRPEPRDDVLYGTVSRYRTRPTTDGTRVTFTFVTDDGQDIEVSSTVPEGDDVLQVQNGDRFTADKAMTNLRDRITVAIQEEAAATFGQVNSYEPWKRAMFRSNPDTVQFAAECGWRFSEDDRLWKMTRTKPGQTRTAR
jgi:hypothetical protein